MCIIEHDDVVKVHRLWKKLYNLDCSQEQSEADMADEQQALTDLLACLKHHHLIPVGLGSGR